MIGLIIACILSLYFFVDRYIVIGIWKNDFVIFWALGIMIGISLGVSFSKAIFTDKEKVDRDDRGCIPGTNQRSVGGVYIPSNPPKHVVTSKKPSNK